MLIILLVNMAIYVVSIGVMATRGDDFATDVNSTSLMSFRAAALPTGGTDSWRPMLRAYRQAEETGAPLYSVFFEEGVKFQYPPTSLLLFDALDDSYRQLVDGQVNAKLRLFLGWASRLAWLAVIGCSFILFEACQVRFSHSSRRADAELMARLFMFAVIGFTFYPLAKAHSLGQIQIYIDVLVAGSILALVLGRNALAGACLGLCCLLKPQFILVLVWGAVRRCRSFCTGMVAVVTAGFGLSLYRFGLANHLDYVSVLRTISRHGEVYWPNQSLNGLLNRFLQKGDPTVWQGTAFAPYAPLVYGLTLAFMLVLLALALWPGQWKAQDPRSHVADYLAFLLAVTMSSPVAWEHHYGILLPICAALMALLLSPLERRPVYALPVFVMGFTGAANVLLKPHFIFSNRWLGLLGSHLFFAGIILFLLLIWLRSVLGAQRSE